MKIAAFSAKCSKRFSKLVEYIEENASDFLVLYAVPAILQVCFTLACVYFLVKVFFTS